MSRPTVRLKSVEAVGRWRTGQGIRPGRRTAPLGRQPAPRRAGAARTGGGWVRPAIGFLVFVEIVLLGGHALRWARTSPRFALSEVVVEGHKALDAREIVRLTALPSGLNVFDVDLDDVRKRVAASPWVRQASVRRQLPHVLRVEVEERRPAVLLRRDPPFGVDAEGVVLGAPLEKPDACLPLFEGFDPQKLPAGSSIWGPEFAAQLAAVRFFSDVLAAHGGCLTVRRAGAGRVRLRTLNGRVDLLVSEDGLEAQAARLRAVIEHVLREPPTSARVELDLTFPGRVVVRPIGQDGGAKG